MELAKVTAKGQVTIPVEIRRKLGLNTGDKLLFIEEDDKIYITSSTADRVVQAQSFLTGAKKSGDVVNG